MSHNPVSKIDINPKEMSQATWRRVQKVFETVDGILEMELSKPKYLNMWTDLGHNYLHQVLNIFRILRFR